MFIFVIIVVTINGKTICQPWPRDACNGVVKTIPQAYEGNNQCHLQADKVGKGHGHRHRNGAVTAGGLNF